MRRITLTSFLPFHQLPSHNFLEVITLLFCDTQPCMCILLVCKSLVVLLLNWSQLKLIVNGYVERLRKLRDSTTLTCPMCPFVIICHSLICTPLFSFMSLHPFFMSLIPKITQRVNPFCCICQLYLLFLSSIQGSFSWVPLVNSHVVYPVHNTLFQDKPSYLDNYLGCVRRDLSELMTNLFSWMHFVCWIFWFSLH